MHMHPKKQDVLNTSARSWQTWVASRSRGRTTTPGIVSFRRRPLLNRARPTNRR